MSCKTAMLYILGLMCRIFFGETFEKVSPKPPSKLLSTLQSNSALPINIIKTDFTTGKRASVLHGKKRAGTNFQLYLATIGH